MQIMDIVSAIIPFIVIVALLYGVLFFIKKYGTNLKKSKSGSVSIKVISSQMIMPKKYISIVKIEDKLLVLGVSENSVTLLKEMDDELKPNVKTDENEEKNNFFDILKKNLGNRFK